MYLLKRVQSSKKLLKQFVSGKSMSRSCLHRCNTLQTQGNEEILSLETKDETLNFPYVWLRDNCQCEQCFHSTAKSRILDWTKFDVNIKPKDVQNDNNNVQITWSDGHTSRYKMEWLKFRNFNSKSQEEYSEIIYKPRKSIWAGADFDWVCSKHEYDQILTSDEALYKWLHNLAVYGVAIIRNTPNTETAIDSIVEKIGFKKQTHYGVKFIVQNVSNTSNVAYLNTNLQMHTDLPYYEYCPGVNLLHCLVQTRSQGGENLLSDCHYIAEYMKKNHPQQFKLLCDVDVEWSDIGTEHGKEFFKLYRSPVICLDKHENIVRINLSIPQRGSHFPGPIDVVKPWYEAHGLFIELNHKFSAKFKTESGDILTFDNVRLLHGRNAYEDDKDNVRKLIGTYVDWDEIYSKIRCLKLKLFNLNSI